MCSSYLYCCETCSDYYRGQRLTRDLSALPVNDSGKTARATELKRSQKPTVINDLLRPAMIREDAHERILVM